MVRLCCLAFACAISLAFVGCADTALQLDRTVAVGEARFSVPSDWPYDSFDAAPDGSSEIVTVETMPPYEYVPDEDEAYYSVQGVRVRFESDVLESDFVRLLDPVLWESDFELVSTLVIE